MLPFTGSNPVSGTMFLVVPCTSDAVRHPREENSPNRDVNIGETKHGFFMEILKVDEIQGRLADAIEIGIEQAQKSPKALFRHGAVVWKGNRIYGVASNLLHDISFFRPTPHGSIFDNGSHAEMQALKNTPPDLKGASILVVRWKEATAELSLSKPCEMCWPKLMKDSRIKKIYWSNTPVEICLYRK